MFLKQVIVQTSKYPFNSLNSQKLTLEILKLRLGIVRGQIKVYTILNNSKLMNKFNIGFTIGFIVCQILSEFLKKKIKNKFLRKHTLIFLGWISLVFILLAFITMFFC